MIKTLKRFIRAKGGLRFKVLYAFNGVAEEEIYGKPFFVCHTLDAGTWAQVDQFKNIRKYEMDKEQN